jgi:hypothetical protein
VRTYNTIPTDGRDLESYTTPSSLPFPASPESHPVTPFYNRYLYNAERRKWTASFLTLR